MNTFECFLTQGFHFLSSPVIGHDADRVRTQKQNQAKNQFSHIKSFVRFDFALSKNPKPSVAAGELAFVPCPKHFWAIPL